MQWCPRACMIFNKLQKQKGKKQRQKNEFVLNKLFICQRPSQIIEIFYDQFQFFKKNYAKNGMRGGKN